MFQVSFVIENKHLGDALEALALFKPRDLEHRPIVNAKAKGRANGVPAWQRIADYIRAAKQPVPAKVAANVIETMGFNRSGISMHLRKAITAKLIRRTARGYVKNGAVK